jgi:hypothetical protein
MISPFFRNDTVEIVVPNGKYRQCLAVEKSKIYASVANRSHLSMDQGEGSEVLDLLIVCMLSAAAMVLSRAKSH